MGSASNMRKVADVVVSQNSRVTVLSAMSGTTDALVKISAMALTDPSAPQIMELIEGLFSKYDTCIGELLTSGAEKARAVVAASFDAIKREASNPKPYNSERVIIAQGELMTSAIFTLYMQEKGIRAVLLHAPDFVVTGADQKVDTLLLEEKLSHLASDPGTYYITQGFICTNSSWDIDNLGRGGSDYSAALIGAAIGADQVQIWTDIDGMHNNDPRFVENTRPIRRMSFDEAAELAYFGAKILHPATIQPCRDKGIAVLLKNTMQPDAEGTRISNEEEQNGDFHAVAAKDGITLVRIHSARMLMAYGFLRKVFEVFENHKTPIDMITTSEVAVSLTIDNDANLDKITAELSALGSIEVERGNTIVCVVGHLGHAKTGLGARLFESIKSAPVKMISYGASDRSIALLIDTQFKKETLQRLNDALF